MSSKIIFGIIIIAIVGILIVNVGNDSKTETVQKCKVEKLVQQQIISGDKDNLSTDIRYLVVTDKETFICESSMLNGKFNNSDIFWHLKEGETYNFKVCGMGKSMVTDYRNILEVVN